MFLEVSVVSGGSAMAFEFWRLGWDLGSATLLDSDEELGWERGSRKGHTLTF